MPNIEYAPPEWEEDEEEVSEDEDREEGDSNNSPDGFPVNSSPSATDDGLDNPNGNKEVSDSEVENSIPREKSTLYFKDETDTKRNPSTPQ